jgi:hypothetical protein
VSHDSVTTDTACPSNMSPCTIQCSHTAAPSAAHACDHMQQPLARSHCCYVPIHEAGHLEKHGQTALAACCKW